MRRLVVSELITLDGVVEAPGGEPSHPHTGWAGDLMSAETEAHKFREVLEAGSLLLGRVTYESFAGAWPTYEGEFADRMNSMPKDVVSSTLRDPAWHGTTVHAGDAVEVVRELTAGDGDPILLNGSATLARALLANDLVDELRFLVFPVLIGGGLRIFPDGLRKTTWDLRGSTPFPGGVREDVYRRA